MTLFILILARLSCFLLLMISIGSFAASTLYSPIFVSKTTEDFKSRYLLAYIKDTPDGWISSLIEVSGNGSIHYIRSTPPNHDRNRVATFTDFRSIAGRRFYFVSYPSFEGDREAPYRQACELGPDGETRNCYEHQYLDIHERLMAPNGDTIFMFWEPRTTWRGGMFEDKPLDLVLRRISPDLREMWKWNSANHLSPDDKVETGDLMTRISRLARKDNVGARVWQKVKVRIERGMMRSLSATGLLDKPLCVKLARDCIVNLLYNDYVHGNSLEWDDDGGIIVSSPAQNTVFKIHYPGGNIAWRLGGYGAKRSDFVIRKDPLEGFARQHSARRLSNGNLILYDNGTHRPDPHSRAVEYRLDFKSMTATLVWEYRAPAEYAHRECCGAVQRLPNGNTLITWGGWETEFHPKRGTLPIATEVDRQGRTVFEIRSRNFEGVYRVWADL